MMLVMLAPFYGQGFRNFLETAILLCNLSKIIFLQEKGEGVICIAMLLLKK